jgi:hypothetical protein
MPPPPITKGDRARLTKASRRLAAVTASLARAAYRRGVATPHGVPADLERWIARRAAQDATASLRGWSGIDLLTLALDLAATRVERGTLRALRAQFISAAVTKSNCR